MTRTAITGNAELVAPISNYAAFARSTTHPDLATLKTYADGFPVPSFVGPGSGTIGSQRASLSDDDIEVCVRDWCWNNLYFHTPSQESTTTPALASITRAAEIYAWREGLIGPSTTNYAGNAALNSGKGPAILCGTIHSLYVGLLAAYGIAARIVSGTSATAGNDLTAEYWSPKWAKWVHVMAHLNAHITLPNGVPASLLDRAQVERSNGLTAAAVGAGIFTAVTYDNSGGLSKVDHISEDLWAGFSVDNAWDRGNIACCAGSGAPPSRVFLGPRHVAAGYTWTKARSLSDVYYTVNALHATARQNSAGVIRCQLEQNMLEFAGFSYRRNAGSWTTMPAQVGAGGTAMAFFDFYPVAGDTWDLRCTGTLGNTSNIITATVTGS